MKEIDLVNGGTAFVDDEDYERVLAFDTKWRNHNGYAVSVKVIGTNSVTKKRMTETTFMHRLIMHAEKGEYIDHINRLTLNNEKCNLRKVDASLNRHNSKMNRNNTTGLRCVTFHPNCRFNPYRVQLRYKGRLYCVGSFPTAEDAARAYNAKLVKLRGEAAILNET